MEGNRKRGVGPWRVDAKVDDLVKALGVDVGPSEDRVFWTAFLRSLVKRELKGVRLVTFGLI